MDSIETLTTTTAFPTTPDGRYLVVRGRLWRKSNPDLHPEVHDGLVKELMSARRAVRDAKGDDAAIAKVRGRVDAAKIALGERGPVWWDDGAPDFNRGSRRRPDLPYSPVFRRLLDDVLVRGLLGGVRIADPTLFEG